MTVAVPWLDPLLARFDAGQPAALARAISVVEDHRPGFDQLLARLHARTGRARRIGITGPPGAGKSTLTTALCAALRAAGKSVGIVCVDPTSPFTGGALLGDRIRMEMVALDPGVYIRSMATRGSLGGLAVSTREACDVLDAFGKDVILIETVGVGQSELDVARTADSTLVVLTPESGDSIQTLKAGVMEIADAYVVNKADRPGADRLKNDIELMLGLRAGPESAALAGHHGLDLNAIAGQDARRDAMQPARVARAAASRDDLDHWTPPVTTAVAARQEGIAEILAALDRHERYLARTGELRRRRRARLKDRVVDAVEQKVRDRLWTSGETQRWVDAQLDALEEGRAAPFDVADALLARSARQLSTAQATPQ
jgi:LAO/AO transport system kinase